MKKQNKKNALILSAVLIPVVAAAVAIPKLTRRGRQEGWRRVD